MTGGNLIQIDYAPRINFGLIHAGLDHVVRSIVVPEGLHARLRVAGFSEKLLLPPGVYRNRSPSLDPHMFARLSAPVEAQIVIEIEDHHDEPHPVQIAPLCAWDQQRQHARATAAFVLENDPVITNLVLQADTVPEPGGNLLPPEEAAERLYLQLRSNFGPCYLFERTLFYPSEQAVRFPLQMRFDRGGTCLDLCLVYAAALLKSGFAPLLLFLNAEGQHHCMVGVWLVKPSAVEAPDTRVLEAARRQGSWVAIEATSAFSGDTYERARWRAEEELARSPYPLLWALDVKAAREASIGPLPSRPCTTTFHHWEARSLDERTKTLATAAAETLKGMAVEVVASGDPADRGMSWELSGLTVGIGRGYRHDIGLLELTVSDPHAALFAHQGKVFVADLFSKNGVLVENRPVPPGQSCPVREGEIFQVGQVELRLIRKAERRSENATDS